MRVGNNGQVNVDLSGLAGNFVLEWYDPTNGTVKSSNSGVGGGQVLFVSPGSNSFGANDWALHIVATDGLIAPTAPTVPANFKFQIVK